MEGAYEIFTDYGAINVKLLPGLRIDRNASRCICLKLSFSIKLLKIKYNHWRPKLRAALIRCHLTAGLKGDGCWTIVTVDAGNVMVEAGSWIVVGIEIVEAGSWIVVETVVVEVVVWHISSFQRNPRKEWHWEPTHQCRKIHRLWKYYLPCRRNAFRMNYCRPDSTRGRNRDLSGIVGDIGGNRWTER